MIDYNELALQVAKAEDPGGELVKILEAVDGVLEATRPAILIIQAVPEDTEANPVVHIAVFTNTETDFPLETRERYVQWVKDYAKGIS